jgi:uncharacterized protein (TIGR02646 family)
MKRVRRLPLSTEALGFLSERSQAVATSADPKTEAGRLWKLKSNKAFREIRAVLETMAPGNKRCMYCEDSHGTSIDHFWPKAGYPERAFDWLNYLLACSACNSNQKRDQFPLDMMGQPLLLNPAEEDPLDHLSFSTTTGEYASLSPKGNSSIRVFGLNREVLTIGRTDAWVALQNLLILYASAKVAGDGQWAGEIEAVVRRFPFVGVFVALLRIASGPGSILMRPECLQVLQDCPEIHGWI